MAFASSTRDLACVSMMIVMAACWRAHQNMLRSTVTCPGSAVSICSAGIGSMRMPAWARSRPNITVPETLPAVSRQSTETIRVTRDAQRAAHYDVLHRRGDRLLSDAVHNHVVDTPDAVLDAQTRRYGNEESYCFQRCAFSGCGTNRSDVA